jgi:ribosome-binding protein aMBF1 (putative translation factor)
LAKNSLFIKEILTMGLQKMMRPSAFGTKIKRLREKKGLRLEDLANQTGYSPEY